MTVRITAGSVISLDERTEEPTTWHFDYLSQQMVDAVDAQYAAAGRILLGRRTYQTFASSWGFRPRDSALGARINELPKIVVSDTMLSADRANCTLRGGDLAAVVAELRVDREAGDVIVPDSIALVRSLLAAGELDRLELMVYPRVVGRGAGLFDDPRSALDLRLVSSTLFDNGVQHTVYAPMVENRRQTR